MKKSLKLLSFFAAVLLALSFLPFSVLAADNTPSVEDYNAGVLAKKTALESKYGIRITYSQNPGQYAGVGTATLDTLDTCLAYVTPEIVKQLSDFYYERNGVKLTISYIHTLNAADLEIGKPVAVFTSSKSLIELYVPKNGTSSLSSLSSGSSPLAIIHEIGHAYQDLMQYKTGEADLKRLWTSLNNGAKYSGTAEYDKNVFVSGYAAMDYDEDFADTFAYAFVCNRAGFSIARYLKDGQGRLTPLGAKVDYLERLIKQFSPKAETAVSNMRRLYTAPESISYRGLYFRGSALEYVGYSAPYGILNAILKTLPYESASSVWLTDLGGWQVTAKNGKEYMVFPGGNYTALK